MVKTQSMIIVGLIFIAFAIPLVQSLELIAGDNILIKFSGVVKNCVILNNHSNLDGLNLTESGKYVYLIIDLTYKPDNFTIQCDVAGVKEERSGGGGGGGGGTPSVPTNATNETTLIPPTPTTEENVTENITEETAPGITGAVTGGKGKITKGIFIFVGILVVGFIVSLILQRKNKPSNRGKKKQKKK